MTDLPPVSTTAALANALANAAQAQTQTLSAFVQQQVAAEVEKLFDLVGSAPLQLDPGTRLNAVVVSLPQAAEILVAAEGSFALETPLPQPPNASPAPQQQTQAASPPQQQPPAGSTPANAPPSPVPTPAAPLTPLTATLIVDGGDNPIHASLVALNGKPLPAPTPIDLVRLAPGVELPASPAGPDPLKRAVFVSPAGVFALAPEQVPRLAANPEAMPSLTLRIQSSGPEIQAQIVAAGPTRLEEALPVTLARIVPGLEFPAVPAGTDAQGRAVLATPVGIFLAPSEPPKDSGILTLRVVSAGPQIETEIIAKDGKASATPARLTLILPEPAALLRTPLHSQPPPVLPQPEAAKILGALGTSWPALHEALSALGAGQPELAKALIDRIPAAGPKFLAQVLGLLAGLQSGNAGQFLGNDVLDALRRSGHGPLADRLEHDVKSASQLAQDSHPEWRPVLMPFFDGAQFHQVPVMIGKPPEKGASQSEQGTRFLVCVDFSALGAVQIDGFVAPSQHRLDVTLRSSAALPDAVRTGVEQRFDAALAGAGFGGRVQFKVANPFPVQVLEQLRFGTGKRLGTIA